MSGIPATKLADFFAAIAPLLEGRETHAEAAARLYGSVAVDLNSNNSQKRETSRDAARLALYGRFCRIHRLDALGSTFAETRTAIVKGEAHSADAAPSGEQAWEQLVADYFFAHPMHHAELNENGSELPAFLRAKADARALPHWIAELADLEWWSFRTRVAPDDPQDAYPARGTLRLAGTVELRPYAHDLCVWLEAEPAAGESRESEPEARACVVIFWRDLDLDTRFAEATPLELLILQAVHQGHPLAEAAARAGASADELAETLADLRAAGILLGGES